jgi:hypothetical protein
MGPDSDDLLAVVREGVHRRRTAHTLSRGLVGLGFATELVVATEIPLWRNDMCSVSETLG